MAQYGFNWDRNRAGEILSRDVHTEWKQRAKLISHAHQISMKADESLKARQKKEEKLTRARTAIEETLLSNEMCEAKLASAMKEGVSVQDAEHPIGSAGDMLRAFLNVRVSAPQDPNTKQKFVPKSLKKGKPVDVNDGNDSVLTRAFALRQDDMVLKLPPDPRCKLLASTRQLSLYQGLCLASYNTRRVLKSMGWLSAVAQVFNEKDEHVMLEVNDQLLWQMDMLEIHLRKRLPLLLVRRFAWFEDNTAEAAALMTLLGYIIDDFDCRAREDSCLLRLPGVSTNAFLPIANHITDQEGGYLYYNPKIAQWIRSGKEMGKSRNFMKRHSEHAKGAKLTTAESRRSRFYRTYARKNSDRKSWRSSSIL